MISQRIPTILPDLTFEEMLEMTKIYSILGNVEDKYGVIKNRPFRNPHHSITMTSMIGGGNNPKPGEITLAHNGVLFLDELPEFNRNILEALRGPLEERKVMISRLNSKITYPCNFMLIASMNPCPCGYYGSNVKKCTCSSQAIDKYIGKISGPLLDRIDIHIEVRNIKYEKLKEKSESSKIIKERVNNARKIQLERYQGLGINSNAELSPNLIEKFCKIDDKGKEILNNVFEKFKISIRAYNKILKIARTIADMENEKDILYSHIAEAIQYRNLDRKFWKR